MEEQGDSVIKDPVETSWRKRSFMGVRVRDAREVSPFCLTRLDSDFRDEIFKWVVDDVVPWIFVVTHISLYMRFWQLSYCFLNNPYIKPKLLREKPTNRLLDQSIAWPIDCSYFQLIASKLAVGNRLPLSPIDCWKLNLVSTTLHPRLTPHHCHAYVLLINTCSTNFFILFDENS